MRRHLQSLLQRLADRPRRGRRLERGFTLLEIMVVLVIMSLIAGTVGVAVIKQLDNAKRKQAGVQIHALSDALELYKLQFHNYPSTAEGLQALAQPKNNAAPFINSVPQDPWGHDYVYVYPGQLNPGGFDVISYGPDGIAGNSDDITNAPEQRTAQQ